LAEFDGEDVEEEEKKLEAKHKNLKNAEKEESLNVELNGKDLVITYQNLSEFIINFYEINLEILFSRNPFLKESSSDFSFVKPNLS